MATSMQHTQPMTLEGFERLQAELEHLLKTERPAMVDQRIDELEAILASVHIAAPPPPGVVDVGQTVLIRISGAERSIGYQLVGPFECDPANARISIGSPIGSALVGLRAGDTAEVETPSGLRHVEVLMVGSGFG